MRILGDEFLAQWEGKIINTHPALLPAFPGAHGVRDALEHGVKVTGVTVHLVDRGVDTGPIIAQRVVAVEDGDTQETRSEERRVGKEWKRRRSENDNQQKPNDDKKREGKTE